MKQIFPAFAAAAVVFTVGASLSVATGHLEWVRVGFVVCAVIFLYVHRRLRSTSVK